MTDTDDSQDTHDPYMAEVVSVIWWARDGGDHHVKLKCGHEAWTGDGELSRVHCDDCEAAEEETERTINK